MARTIIARSSTARRQPSTKPAPAQGGCVYGVKRGRKPIFQPAIFKERFRTIERVFAWEDKFRRLLLHFKRISELHYTFKTLAYTMINLRHYCQIRSSTAAGTCGISFRCGVPRPACPRHAKNRQKWLK
jgi:hypothetical protein